MHIVPPYHSNIELENGNDNHQSPKTWSRENSPWFVVKTRAKRGGGDDHRKFQIGWTRTEFDGYRCNNWMWMDDTKRRGGWGLLIIQMDLKQDTPPIIRVVFGGERL